MWWADNNGSGFEGGLMASRVSMKVLNFRFLSCETGCNASNCRRWRFLLVLPSLSSLSLIIPSLGAQWVWSKTGRKAKALVGNSTIQKLCPEVGGSGARDSEVEGRGVRGVQEGGGVVLTRGESPADVPQKGATLWAPGRASKPSQNTQNSRDPTLLHALTRATTCREEQR